MSVSSAPAAPSFPRKLFYKITEAAEITGVEPHVLRYWETRFPMLKPERYGNEERRYRESDIRLLLRIRSLLYEEKYQIAGAVEKIREERSGKSSAGRKAVQAPKLPAPQLARLRAELAAIRQGLVALASD